MIIRAARADEAATLCALRSALWPDTSATEHARDVEAFFAGRAREPLAILVAEDGAADGGSRLVGFCELSIRAYAEGCDSDQVGYLEGWYVAPEARRQGVGRALVAAAEDWARARGCTEFASDAEVDNEVSAAAHQALGFAETGIIRCFRKAL